MKIKPTYKNFKIALFMGISGLCFLTPSFSQNNNTWTWMTGSNLTNQAAVYGTLGVANAANTPGARSMSVEWTDQFGRFWLFGGMKGPLSGVELNDLWMYDPATNMWTWMNGSSAGVQTVGTYGTKGVAAPANTPGSKARSMGWVDNNGYLWLYGGTGSGTNGGSSSPNDLWRLDPNPASPIYNQWMWVHGNTIGTPATYGTMQVANATNDPGSRAYGSCTWTETATNSLWFFGASGKNDVWKYDIATDMWTWMAGGTAIGTPPVYGALGVAAAANTPGGRDHMHTGWKDKNGDYWIYGSFRRVSAVAFNYYSDMWKLDLNPASPSYLQWAWMAGPSAINQPAVWGTQCVEAATNRPPQGGNQRRTRWVDDCGNFWLWDGGEYVNSFYNSLWKFNPTTLRWTWMGGPGLINQPGVYGTQGVPAPGNIPGGRMAASFWKNQDGFWIFGGWTNGAPMRNDLWKYIPQKPLVAFDVSDSIGCVPHNVNFTNNSNSNCGSDIKTVRWSFGDPASGSANTSTANNPSHTYSIPGTYTAKLYITNCLGVTDSTSHTITTGSLSINISAATDVSCNGFNDGTATANIITGTPTYTFSWSSIAQTGATVTGLSPATYTVTVNDGVGCTAQSTVTITEPPILFANINSQTNVLCYGQNTGAASVGVLGGTPTYNYNWSNGQNNSNASNLVAGVYTVTITDNHGCTLTRQATITEPPDITLGVVTTSVSCYGGTNGTANANAVGGVGSFNYAWVNSLGSTTNNATSLAAGNYTVIVTDGNGCTETATLNISQPSLIFNLGLAGNDVRCFGENSGSINSNLNGGTNPFNYNWSNGSTTTNLSNIIAGTYSLTITDGNGCTTQSSITITEPAILTASISAQTNILCYQNTTGSATVAVGGGIPAYNYNWSPSGQNNATANNLGATNYTVVVTDNNGCTVQANANITEPPILSATLTPVDLLCNNISTGQVNTNISGGNPSYTYAWSSGATTNNLSGVAAGNYTLTITDANGCTLQANTNITEPTLLVTNANSTPDHCNQNDGTATIIANNGTPAYVYSWSNGQSTSSISNLTSGNYTATVTDNNGCTSTQVIAVGAIANDTLQLVSITNANCNTYCDGVAQLQLSGVGNGPYVYNWNTASPQNTLTATGLCAGVYTCSVTDASGCVDVMNVTVTQPAAISATLSSTSTLCFGDSTGTAAVINTSGGTPNFTYSWSNGDTDASIINLTANTYTLTITDGNGCSASQTIQVNNALQLVLNIVPTASICVGQVANINSNIVGGTPNYIYNWNTGQNTNNISVSPSQTTAYTLTATDNNGCTVQTTTQVNVNPLPDVSFNSDVTQGCATLCVNFSNTTANSQSQVWNFGSGNSTQLNPNYCFTDSGLYNITLTVTDNNGCSNTLTQNNYITVYPNPLAQFSASPQPATVLNPIIQFTDLSQQATQWDWSFGDITNSGSSLQNPTFSYSDSGHYAVRLIVQNQYGCTDTANDIVIIKQDFVMYIPNTFSQNGDNMNDVFTPSGIGIDVDKYDFWIYDRWGDMIYHSTNPALGWNGVANNGKAVAQQDTYVWKVSTTDMQGYKHRYIGHVNLIR